MLSLVLGALGGLAGLWIKWITDGVVSTDARLVVGGIVGLCAGQALVGAGGSVAALVRQTVTEKAQLLVEADLATISGSIPTLDHLDDPEFLDKLSLARRDAPVLVAGMWALADCLTLALQIVITCGLLARVSPWLLMLPLAGAPGVLAGRLARRRANQAQERTAEQERRYERLFELGLAAESAQELTVLDLAPELDGRQQNLWRDVDDIASRADRYGMLLRLAAWLAFWVVLLATNALVAVRAARGSATLGDIALVLTAGSQTQFHLSQAVALTAQTVSSLRAVRCYQWLLSYRAGLPHSPVRQAGSAALPARLVRGIDVTNLTFRYPGADAPTLQGLNAHLPAGATVAVVGENGAGKSTFVNLLCGFYTPDSGSITIDGIDLSELEPTAWRARLTVGFQQFARYQFLLHETIGVGNVAAIDDLAQITAATELADAGSVVSCLSDGLASQLGVQFGGADLSRGQWQKTALARATMPELPLVLILDEPTAAIDAAAEHMLFERYRLAATAAADANGGLTVLISHRFSTVRHADLIIVLDRGHVIETGTHTDLMRLDGLYAAMFRAHARALA